MRNIHDVYTSCENVKNTFSGLGGFGGGWPKKPVLIQDFMWETPGHAKMCQKCPVEPLSNRFFRLPP